MNQRWVKYPLALLCVFIVFIWNTPTALAFCGFFVGKADSQLHNSSSRVVIAHSGNRSIFSMANDYQGDVKDFARIVPIPVVPNRDQVRVGNLETVERLNAFTAPRLAEYIDDPCIEEINLFVMGVNSLLILSPFVALVWAIRARRLKEFLVVFFLIGIFLALALPSIYPQANKGKGSPFNFALNVTVEDKFTVGEYDVVILSAKQSNGLTTWLIQNGYKVPTGAQQMLQSYIAQGMKFFVVKVNLTEFEKSGYGFLRPIVLDYESPKFMLPIRLGTLNSTGEQDLIIHILSPDGYAEVSNYRTAPIPTDNTSQQSKPSGEELPYFLKEQDNFSKFYEVMFQREYERQGKNVAFLEYAGAIKRLDRQSFGKCDPCTVSQGEILKLMELLPEIDPFNSSYVTRLHVRYTQEKFPEDLEFRIVGPEFDRFTEATAISSKVSSLNIFQGRYVIRRPKSGAFCIARLSYRKWNKRWMDNLTRLTGWDKMEIGKMASR
ncbi:DUF2330 domain-containing protein [Microcoleus sp. FACHB-831]|uniref:DUF2330 domain-containing protein n=1 Tax=Microcoleus sp. FACHB-831 TaxID=2692827 RepID=UPI0016883158|nr:DUF2330 domain-containing protein [Microcoleus sp. FACHB-831]MBD1923722.1 DUF2330 domain-containing protein [Microcoleus sp. FACHB-831]